MANQGIHEVAEYNLLPVHMYNIYSIYMYIGLKFVHFDVYMFIRVKTASKLYNVIIILLYIIIIIQVHHVTHLIVNCFKSSHLIVTNVLHPLISPIVHCLHNIVYMHVCSILYELELAHIMILDAAAINATIQNYEMESLVFLCCE